MPSPVGLSILDNHFGTIETRQKVVDEIHAWGMCVVPDHAFATLGDLIGFEGYLNETTPFQIQEHKVQYKSQRQYSMGISASATLTTRHARIHDSGTRLVAH